MEESIKNLLEKIASLKKEGKLDLSSDEDLSLAVMNLISLEEHFYFTAAKTGKNKYYDLLEEVRKIRQVLLGKLVGQTEGEVWCISKHLLGTTMRLIEVGTKYHGDAKKKEAEDFFTKAWSLYSLFWGIKFGAKEGKGREGFGGLEGTRGDREEKNLQGKLEDLVKKIVDCCK